MEIINNSNSVIIVLHEIYGINQHIQSVCKRFSTEGYDIICPNLISTSQPYTYDLQEEAYHHFMDKVGFDSAVQEVKQIIVKAQQKYMNVFIIGYSIGATIAWLCSNEENICNGIIGYYGSRIRDYMNITPQCPTLLLFSKEESSFDVKELVASLEKQQVDVHILEGKHGFSDLFSENYCEKSSEEAARLVDKFLMNYTNSKGMED